MSKARIIKCVMIGLLFCFYYPLQAVELHQQDKTIIPDRISTPVTIDGELDEAAWNRPPISRDFMTFFPVYGERLDQQTRIWMLYDSQKLYFAFKCFDPEPQKIKTSISKRDQIDRDDWIGVIIDAVGNRQASCEFYVNPDGIQADYLNSAISSGNKAPDFVWESAGKKTGDGYQAEIAIPFESIRFKSGREVKMGVLFIRHVSHLGTVGAWPEIKAGQTGLTSMATALYSNIQKKLNLEVLPNFTYGRDTERENIDAWQESDESSNIGVSVKYGLTSSITTEATLYPDFSQVESDAFQVEVNRRYPVFYTEKRPFFMEGMDVFDFGKVTQGMMVASVHTRRIVDPSWAAKLSGAAGKLNFALLTANDRIPDQEGETGEAIWGIGRIKYDLSSDNSLGILYSSRFLSGNANHVGGLDLQYRPFKNARLNAAYLFTGTRESVGTRTVSGSGFNALFQYTVPQLRVWAAYELYDSDFTMYSAFINRTAISRGQFYIGPSFYMKLKGASWFRRLEPHLQFTQLHDLGTGLDDTCWNLGLDMYFTRQGFFKIEYRGEEEAWQGTLFNQKYLYSYGEIQLSKWLLLLADFRYGDQIYYDPEDPFLGSGGYLRLGITFQPNVKLSLNLEGVHSVLKRKSDRQKFYEVNIINLHTAYQFNRFFYIRGVLRYDDFQNKLLTDFLASFTLIPGTVLHLGYGSLYEGRVWQNNEWLYGRGDLLNVKNSLFFKVSYLWRIK